MATAGEDRTTVPVLEREKTCNTHLTKGVHLSKELFYCYSGECKMYRVHYGRYTTFDGHMTLLTTLQTSSALSLIQFSDSTTRLVASLSKNEGIYKYLTAEDNRNSMNFSHRV